MGRITMHRNVAEIHMHQYIYSIISIDGVCAGDVVMTARPEHV